MTSHADTIQDFQCELDRIGIEVGASAARTWMWQNRELVLAALEALLAENQRLRDALETLEAEFMARGGLAASPQDVVMYLRIAREALAGDTE